MTSPFGCFLCCGADHWASNCPESQPPKTKAEYDERFAKYLRWCFEDEPARITPFQKRKLIENLNAMWKAKQKETVK